MGVLGKSRQGCVGVINNIGALTSLLTKSRVAKSKCIHVYRLFVNVNGHLEMLYAIDTLSNYAHLNSSCNTALVLHVIP